MRPAVHPRLVTVSQLNRIARELLEQGLPLLWVSGEISNLRIAGSGHCYFSLKDREAQVSCVFFRSKFSLLGWLPENGSQVEVHALPTLYEARGEFQLCVEMMRRAGLGSLFEAFDRLKTKLERKGLFSAARKRPIPNFPRCIGVITSRQAAALSDVLSILGRRMPSIPVLLYPAPVQGAAAAQRLAAAVALASARRECDVLLLIRGGGSIEDLWAFNEEVLAQAIADSAIPVVTGIGHETDFTIADFVADARAATPSAAAEMVTPSRLELLERIAGLRQREARAMAALLGRLGQRIDYAVRRLLTPAARVARQRLRLDHLERRLAAEWRRRLEKCAWRVQFLARRLAQSAPKINWLSRNIYALQEQLTRTINARLGRVSARLIHVRSQLEHLNPEAVLARGYSITETADGRLVRDSAQLSAGDRLRLRFGRGAASAEVLGIDGAKGPSA